MYRDGNVDLSRFTDVSVIKGPIALIKSIGAVGAEQPELRVCNIGVELCLDVGGARVECFERLGFVVRWLQVVRLGILIDDPVVREFVAAAGNVVENDQQVAPVIFVFAAAVRITVCHLEYPFDIVVQADAVEAFEFRTVCDEIIRSVFEVVFESGRNLFGGTECCARVRFAEHVVVVIDPGQRLSVLYLFRVGAVHQIAYRI